MKAQEEANREKAISRGQHLVSYAVALFSVYLEAPNLKDLECHWGDDGKSAVLYACDRNGDVLAVSRFELENEVAEGDFDPASYVEGFVTRTMRPGG